MKSAQHGEKMCKTPIQDQRQQLPVWETLVGFYADSCQRTRLPAGMRFQDVLQLPAFDTSKATALWDSDSDSGLLFAPQSHKVAGLVDHSLMKKSERYREVMKKNPIKQSLTDPISWCPSLYALPWKDRFAGPQPQLHHHHIIIIKWRCCFKGFTKQKETAKALSVMPY